MNCYNTFMVQKNMSYEEKLLRRKMNNRISAQIARDRKKAFIKDLENKVRILENEKSDLVIENKKLYRIFNTLNLQQKLASLNKSDFTLNKKVAPILNIDSSNDLKSEINIPSPPYSPTGDEHIEIFQNSELNCNAYVTLKSSELPYLKEEEIEIINKDDAHKEKLSGDISTLNDFTHKPCILKENPAEINFFPQQRENTTMRKIIQSKKNLNALLMNNSLFLMLFLFSFVIQLNMTHAMKVNHLTVLDVSSNSLLFPFKTEKIHFLFPVLLHSPIPFLMCYHNLQKMIQKHI
ncbi:uncharacterized protein LOC135924552 isoform X2 [Gordionus sp. m RMFG-2023]|uniref:uncharacterized protein LOC135924552 isoform X1 n=1 Tax=Gordionus sp. m RMFG-2023 TaxID=3053472 RepID=UPI0031FE2019